MAARPDRLLRIAEVAEMTGLSVSAIRNRTPCAAWLWQHAIDLNAGQLTPDKQRRRPVWRWSQRALQRALRWRSAQAAEAAAQPAAKVLPFKPKRPAVNATRENIGGRQDEWQGGGLRLVKSEGRDAKTGR